MFILPRAVRAAACLLLLFWVHMAHAGTDVLTNANDDRRSGANLAERTLHTRTVRAETFGRQFHYTVDGPVLGQPLVVAGLDTPAGKRDVLFVVTGSNSVYALDAHDATVAPLWKRELTRLPEGRPAMPNGIWSTPAIDRASLTLYTVASLADGDRTHFVLHALDLRDGRDARSGPVRIAGEVEVAGERVAFEPSARRVAIQRAGLALAGGKLIVAFGGDFFEGWVFAFDARDLAKTPSAVCTVCASRVRALSGVNYLDDECILLGPGGGIWQSGRAPAVDAAGRVYFFTSNKQHVIKRGCLVPHGRNGCAMCDDEAGCRCEGNRSDRVCAGPDACRVNRSPDAVHFDLNETLLVLDAAADLRLLGWFRPENWDDEGEDGLERNDLDLGGSGPLLLPTGNRIVGGGKQGVLYALDVTLPESACQPSAERTCIPAEPVQSFAIAAAPPPPRRYARHLFGAPVLWERASEQGGSRLYVWRLNDMLRSYRLSDRFEDCVRRDPAPTATHSCTSAAQGGDYADQHPGAMLSFSADGADSASAIVWASLPRMAKGPGRLVAYAAEPSPDRPGELPRLFDSEDCEEDVVPSNSDFVPPTIANGRVYLAAGANRVEVFGVVQGKTCTPVPRVEGPGPLLQ